MFKIFKKYIIITAVFIGIICGISIEKVFSNDTLKDSLLKFEQVFTYTSRYYLEDVNNYKLNETAIKAIMEELDPHSVYLPPKKQKDEEEKFQGNFSGIGIEYQVISDTIVIVSPITGGPCENAGILAGDKIVTVDDKSCIGFSNEEIRKNFRGEKGSKVQIGILRNGSNNVLNYEIIRDNIPIHSVNSSLMWDDEIGYLSLGRFAKTSTTEIFNALNSLKQKGMKKLILDLRNNPGGLLSQACSISDIFIDGNKKIVYTKGRITSWDQTYNSQINTSFENVPLIILVNRGSASASEIVSGAVQDWDRGLIVGETTFGKGLVQRVFTLKDKSAIRLTTAKYYTPSGRQIQRDYDDKFNYYKSINKRNETEGENLKHNTEKDSVRPIFKTSKGRNVYGGGGITPDYIIKSEKLTNYTVALSKANLFYLFVRKYLELNKSQLQVKFADDLLKFKKEFLFTDEDEIDFLNFAEENKIKFVKEDYDKDKKFIFTRLKGYIAREFWKNNGWYQVLLENDKVFIQSTSLFDEAEKLSTSN